MIVGNSALVDGAPEAAEPLDDRALVERARTEPDAFAELYRRYLPRIYAFAYRQCRSRPVAEDVTAATFERVVRSLPDYRWQGGGFGPWIFRIASNEVANHYRRERRTTSERAQRSLQQLAAPVPDGAFERVEGVPTTRALLDAMATLKPRYREAISLRYFAELSHGEAAAAMGVSKPVMAVTLHRALAALRRALPAEEVDR